MGNKIFFLSFIFFFKINQVKVDNFEENLIFLVCPSRDLGHEVAMALRAGVKRSQHDMKHEFFGPSRRLAEVISGCMANLGRSGSYTR